MSLGVTISPSPAPARASGSSPSCPASARISAASVPASTTVGTPTAMTGTPKVSRLRAARWLPTPEPGTMPVLANCTVVHTRSMDREARASTAMMQPGRIFSATAFTSSPLSTPVVPSTPAAKAATGRKEPKCSGACSTRWRVTMVWSATPGPMASGVMARLPSPTTRHVASSGSLSSPFSSAAMAWAARPKASSSRRARASSCTVT